MSVIFQPEITNKLDKRLWIGINIAQWLHKPLRARQGRIYFSILTLAQS